LLNELAGADVQLSPEDLRVMFDPESPDESINRVRAKIVQKGDPQLTKTLFEQINTVRGLENIPQEALAQMLNLGGLDVEQEEVPERGLPSGAAITTLQTGGATRGAELRNLRAIERNEISRMRQQLARDVFTNIDLPESTQRLAEIQSRMANALRGLQLDTLKGDLDATRELELSFLVTMVGQDTDLASASDSEIARRAAERVVELYRIQAHVAKRRRDCVSLQRESSVHSVSSAGEVVLLLVKPPPVHRSPLLPLPNSNRNRSRCQWPGARAQHSSHPTRSVATSRLHARQSSLRWLTCSKPDSVARRSLFPSAKRSKPCNRLASSGDRTFTLHSSLLSTVTWQRNNRNSDGSQSPGDHLHRRER
jgi:hypothetical protein